MAEGAERARRGRAPKSRRPCPGDTVPAVPAGSSRCGSSASPVISACMPPSSAPAAGRAARARRRSGPGGRRRRGRRHARMSVKRWLIIRIDTPRAFSCSIRPISTRIFSADSAAVGSSRSSSARAGTASARATATSWRWPPDSAPHDAVRCRGRLPSSRIASAPPPCHADRGRATRTARAAGAARGRGRRWRRCRDRRRARGPGRSSRCRRRGRRAGCRSATSRAVEADRRPRRREEAR